MGGVALCVCLTRLEWSGLLREIRWPLWGDLPDIVKTFEEYESGNQSVVSGGGRRATLLILWAFEEILI